MRSGTNGCCSRPAPPLRADVLLVPHHGSRTSSAPAFLAAVRPLHALFTTGYRNRFGHPKPEVLARDLATGAAAGRTDRDRVVTVTIATGGLKVARCRDEARRYWH